MATRQTRDPAPPSNQTTHRGLHTFIRPEDIQRKHPITRTAAKCTPEAQHRQHQTHRQQHKTTISNTTTATAIFTTTPTGTYKRKCSGLTDTWRLRNKQRRQCGNPYCNRGLKAKMTRKNQVHDNPADEAGLAHQDVIQRLATTWTSMLSDHHVPGPRLDTARIHAPVPRLDTVHKSSHP